MSEPSASEIRRPFNAKRHARAWSRPPAIPACTKGIADSAGHQMAIRVKVWRAFGYGIKTDDRFSVGLRRCHVPLVAMT